MFGAWANVAVAGATLVLAAIAVYQQKIIRWLFRPKIGVSGSALYTPWADGTGSIRGKVLYLHLRLPNSGEDAARDAEVSVEEVYEERPSPASGFVRVREAEFPKMLVWSYLPDRTTMPFVHPETTKVIAFGHIHDATLRPPFEVPPEPPATTPPAATAAVSPTLALEVPAAPLNRSHVFAAGIYRMHVVVSASNMKALHATVDLELTGTWNDADAGSVVRFAVKGGWTPPA